MPCRQRYDWRRKAAGERLFGAHLRICEAEFAGLVIVKCILGPWANRRGGRQAANRDAICVIQRPPLCHLKAIQGPGFVVIVPPLVETDAQEVVVVAEKLLHHLDGPEGIVHVVIGVSAGDDSPLGLDHHATAVRDPGLLEAAKLGHELVRESELDLSGEDARRVHAPAVAGRTTERGNGAERQGQGETAADPRARQALVPGVNRGAADAALAHPGAGEAGQVEYGAGPAQDVSRHIAVALEGFEELEALPPVAAVEGDADPGEHGAAGEGEGGLAGGGQEVGDHLG